MTLKARIKPYDPKLGHLMQTVVLAVLANRKFEVGKMYDVTEAEADVLRSLRSRLGSVDGPFAFDIGTPEEMARIVSGEAKSRLGLTPEIIAAIRETADGRDVTEDPRTGALTKGDIDGESVPSGESVSSGESPSGTGDAPKRQRRTG